MHHHCMASSFQVINGDSTYNKRHAKGHCKAKMIPYGARVDFLPPPNLKDRLPLFGPSAVPGVFMGWHMHPGGHWSRDYFVGYLPDLESINDGKSKRLHVYRVRDIVFDNKATVAFPLKEAKDRIAGSVEKPVVDVEPVAVTEETPAIALAENGDKAALNSAQDNVDEKPGEHGDRGGSRGFARR